MDRRRRPAPRADDARRPDPDRPTAAAPEGEEVFRRWARMGLDHFARSGLGAEVLELRAREDALRGDVAEKLRNRRAGVTPAAA